MFAFNASFDCSPVTPSYQILFMYCRCGNILMDCMLSLTRIKGLILITVSILWNKKLPSFLQIIFRASDHESHRWPIAIWFVVERNNYCFLTLSWKIPGQVFKCGTCMIHLYRKRNIHCKIHYSCLTGAGQIAKFCTLLLYIRMKNWIHSFHSYLDQKKFHQKYKFHVL